jgi:excinuclease UvrABC ATPase subunit
MALSTCVKCGSHLFSLQEASISGANFKEYFVQCSSCGGVVGVVPHTNTAAMLSQQNKVIKDIAEKLGIHARLDT